jgi:hypothetical protein
MVERLNLRRDRPAVELVPHSPEWAGAAAREAARLAATLGDNLVAVHHIGSTAIASIRAKPVLDLLPIVRRQEDLDPSCTRSVMNGKAPSEFRAADFAFSTIRRPSTPCSSAFLQDGFAAHRAASRIPGLFAGA